MDRGSAYPFRNPSALLTWSLTVVAIVACAVVLGSWPEGQTGAGQAAAIMAIVLLAALISSVAGFAFSALAGAGLLYLSLAPTDAVQLMITCSIGIQIYSIIALRDSIDWRRLVPFLFGGAVTVPLGIELLTRSSTAAFSIGLGVLLVGYGGYMLARRGDVVLRGNRLADLAVGAAGGLTGGLAAFPGAFVTVWCGIRGWSKDEQRGIIQPYILIMQLLALPLLGAAAPRPQIDCPVLVFLPVAILGAHLGIAVFRRLSNRQFNVVVYGLLIVAGLALALKPL